MSLNRGGLSTFYIITPVHFTAAGSRFEIDIQREATLTDDLRSIESRYVNRVSLRRFGEDTPRLTLNKSDLPDLIAALQQVQADVEGDEEEL